MTRTDIQREVPMAFELKYPGLNFRRATAMEALLSGLEEGDYIDASVREAFHCHVHISKGKMIHYFFDELTYQGHIEVVELSIRQNLKNNFCG